MGSDEINKIGFMGCIEVVLMRRNNTRYHLVSAKLKSLYNCELTDCYEHPEYLRIVLKEVYSKDYKFLLEEFRLELDKLVDIEKKKTEFFRIMES